METPELRVGGWEKEGRGKWFKRIFSLILISFLGFLIIGPSLIEYQNADPEDSTYLDTGLWNGPFEIKQQKNLHNQPDNHLILSKLENLICYLTIPLFLGSLLF